MHGNDEDPRGGRRAALEQVNFIYVWKQNVSIFWEHRSMVVTMHL